MKDMHYICSWCGRKMVYPIPHKCNGNFRKQHLKFKKIMTKELAKRHLDMIKAFAEGETLQSAYYDCKGNIHWQNETDPTFDYDSIYRIKPKYRPFFSKEECFEEMKKHKSMGWIKDNDCLYSVTIIDKKGIYFSDWEDGTLYQAFKTAFDCFKFVDGTPFGIKEE